MTVTRRHLLETTSSLEDLGVVLRLHGELDLTTVEQIEAPLALAEQRAADSHSALVLDLAELDFLDSSGLRLLLTAARRSRGSGRRFAVANPNVHVRRLFALTAVDRTLEVIPSVAAV